VFFFNKLIISERSRLVFKFNRFTFKFQETKFQARRFESLLGVSILDGVFACCILLIIEQCCYENISFIHDFYIVK